MKIRTSQGGRKWGNGAIFASRQSAVEHFLPDIMSITPQQEVLLKCENDNEVLYVNFTECKEFCVTNVDGLSSPPSPKRQGAGKIQTV